MKIKVRKKYTALLLFTLIVMSAALCRIYYKSFIDKTIWSISIYAGTNPYDFYPHPLSQRNPAWSASDVTDVPAIFVADPFMVNHNNTWYMFFEVWNTLSDQGDIGLASSKDGVVWQYEKIILDEPFHLSYPYIFKWKESYYMIPSSRWGGTSAVAVKLYKAAEFPTKWIFVSDLIVGKYADSSIVFKDDKWWLFSLKDTDMLTLHYAEEPNGQWTEHPESPIIKDDRNISRPGGRLIIHDDKIIRYTQDCEPKYGNQLRAFQVDEITTTKYREHEVTWGPILTASGNGWNATGMHHIDPHMINKTNWIACVDGRRDEKIFSWKRGVKRFLNELGILHFVTQVVDTFKE